MIEPQPGVWRKRPGPEMRHSGNMANPAFQPVSLRPYIGRWVFLSMSQKDFTERSQEPEDDETEELERESHANQLIETPFAHSLSSYSDAETYLFDYFVQGIGPKCSLSESDNPYISLITPLFFFSQTFRHALLAAAANQLCLSGDARFTAEACRFKGLALQGLQRDISIDICSDSIAATVLMLCFQDVQLPVTVK